MSPGSAASLESPRPPGALSLIGGALRCRGAAAVSIPACRPLSSHLLPARARAVARGPGRPAALTSTLMVKLSGWSAGTRETTVGGIILAASPRPVFDVQTRDLAEVAQVSAEQCGVGHEGNARDPEIERSDANSLLTQCAEAVFCFLRERKHIHPAELPPHRLKLGVSMHDMSRRTISIQERHPPLHLFLETDDRRARIVGSKRVYPGTEPVALWLDTSLQNRQMICVEH